MRIDCQSKILCRMVNGLLKTAQGVPLGAETSLNLVQDAGLKLAAIKCLVGVLRSMGNWLNRQLRLTDSSPYMKPNDGDENTSEAGESVSAQAPPPALVSETGEESGEKIDDKIGEKNGEVSSSFESRSAEETSEAATFEQRRAYKLEVQVLVILNKQTKSRCRRVLFTLLIE